MTDVETEGIDMYKEKIKEIKDIYDMLVYLCDNSNREILTDCIDCGMQTVNELDHIEPQELDLAIIKLKDVIESMSGKNEALV